MISTTRMIEEGHVLPDGQLLPDSARNILYLQLCELVTEEVIVKAGSQPTPILGETIVYKAQQPTQEAKGSFQHIALPVAV